MEPVRAPKDEPRDPQPQRTPADIISDIVTIRLPSPSGGGVPA